MQSVFTPVAQRPRPPLWLALLCLALTLVVGCTSVGGAPRVPAARGSQSGPPPSGAPGGSQAASALTFDELKEVAQAITENYAERVSPTTLLAGAVRGFHLGAAEAGIWPMDSALVSYVPRENSRNPEVEWDILESQYLAARRKMSLPQRNMDLITPMIKGMVAALEDPTTTYLDREMARGSDRSQVAGIGMTFAYVEGESLPVVSDVRPNSPAAQAGVRVGELLVAIDGRATSSMNHSEAVRALRGPTGTVVRLTLRSPGSRDARELSIERAAGFPYRAQLIDELALLVEVPAFDDGIADQVGLLLDQAVRGGARGLILDLRGNRGAGIEEIAEALKIGALVVGNRPLGFTITRAGRRDQLPTPPVSISRPLPVVVLIDGTSATGAELLAAGLRDYEVAQVVGTPTYGAGAITRDLVLTNGAMVRIAIQSVASPSGTLLRRNGVIPDEVVELTAEDRATGRDPQVLRAMALLRKTREGEK